MNNFLVRIAAIIIWLTILGILVYFNKSSNDQMYTENKKNLPIILLSTTYITATFRIKNVHSEIAF